MKRRFSWCTVAALFVLLVVTTEGLRNHETQIDDHKTHDVTNRGGLRFGSKSIAESKTTSTSTQATSPASKSRSNRDRTLQSRRSSNIDNRQENTTQKDLTRSNVRISRTTEKSRSPPVPDLKKNIRAQPLVRKIEDKPRAEPNRRSDRRYLPENNEGRKTRDNDQEIALETPKESSVTRRTAQRRSTDASEKLGNKGPSVFTATTEFSRSRTGRKIQTSYTSKEIKSQVPSSRRFTNKTSEITEAATREPRKIGETNRWERFSKSNGSKTNNKEDNSIGRKGQDAHFSASESVRVDIPLNVGLKDNPISKGLSATADLIESSSTTSQRQSPVSISRRSEVKENSRNNSRVDRTKSRGRSNDSDAAAAVSRGASRRGASKFSDSVTTETDESSVNSRRNSNVRDRARNSEVKPRNSATESRGRSRGRNVESSSRAPTPASGQESRRRSSGDRNSERRSRLTESRPKNVENRLADQDTRGRSRGRSRVDSTTTLLPEVTTNVVPETTLPEETPVTATEAETMITTMNPVTPTPTSATVRTSTRTSSTSSTTEASGRNRGRARSGSTQGRNPPKEDFFNHGLGFRGRKVSPESTSVGGESRRVNATKNETQPRGNPGWTLRRRPGNANKSEVMSTSTIVSSTKDQTNEIVPLNEQLTSTQVITTIETSTTTTIRRGSKKSSEETTTKSNESTTAKSARRGNKTYEKSATFSLGKSSVESAESDNYPPEFKAKLSQLKNTSTKAPVSKPTQRTPTEVQKSAAALFAERSRMKLELARRLVKPELNIEDNDLVPTSTLSFGKSTETPSTENSQDEEDSKSSRSRKTSKNPSKNRSSILKKGRIISERMVTSISVEDSTEIITEQTTRPYESSNPSVFTASSSEQGSETTIDSTRIRPPVFRSLKKSKEDNSIVSNKSTRSRITEKNQRNSTIEPKKSYSSLRNARVNEDEGKQTSTTSRSKKIYTSIRGSKSSNEYRRSKTSQEIGTTKKSTSRNVAGKTGFQPRYSKRTKPKILENEVESHASLKSKTSMATSRYSRNKSEVSVQLDTKNTTTEGVPTQTKKQEFRPRTATYRRHSEVPTTKLAETSTIGERVGVTITPRPTRYHASVKSSTTASPPIAQEPIVNLKIANDSAQQNLGITGSSNGDSGNTNIFSPTRNVFVAGNETLLEQLRSTVAPLLRSLGNKTPVFAGAYTNVSNENSAARITPNGSPPRFSARYKGAELFVRKPIAYQPTVPSITSSSTTPSTPVESSGSLPLIDISNPGEPRFRTFYQALESANIRNDQTGRVVQVDSNDTALNGTSNNSNNDTTSPVATASPQTLDTTVNTIQDITQTARLFEETENSTPSITTEAPENPSTTTSTESVATRVTTDSLTTSQRTPASTESIGMVEQTTSETTTRDELFQTVDSFSRLNDSGSEAVVEMTTLSLDLQRSLAPSMADVSAGTNSASDGNAPDVNSSPTTEKNLESSAVPETTTVASTTRISSNSMESTTVENPDNNGIQVSGVTSTEATTRVATEATTMDEVSDNLIDVESTTSQPVTTTFRTRLVDFAEDILSRLKATVSTTPRVLDYSTMPTWIPISNAIPDSSRGNLLASLAQVKETTSQTTQPGVTTTRNAVGSITTSFFTTNQPDLMISTEDTSTLDETVATTTQNSASRTDSTTNAITDSSLANFGSSLDSTLSTEAVNDLVTTSRYTTSTNDTLLTELMSIAKTLLSEEMNETQQMIATQGTSNDTVGIVPTNFDTSMRVIGNSIENDVLSTTQVPETSTSPSKVTLESTTIVGTTVPDRELTTSPVVSNETIESDPTATTLFVEVSTDESNSSTTPRANLIENEVEIERNATSTILGPSIENLESNTQSSASGASYSIATTSETADDRPSTVPPTTTQSTETTVVNFELTTNYYDSLSSNTIDTIDVQSSTSLTTEPTTETTTANRPSETSPSSVLETTTSPVNISPPATSQSSLEDTNTTTESPKELASNLSSTEVNNETTRAAVDATKASTNRPTLTTSTEPACGCAINYPTSETEAISTFDETSTTNDYPQTTPNLENETPTTVARFQDTTPATAQGTAGSGFAETTETNIFSIGKSTSRQSLTSPESLGSTTVSPSVETTPTTLPTETTTSTSTERFPNGRIPATTTETSREDVITVTAISETTLSADINDNLISTEATPPADGTTTVSTETSNTISRMDSDMAGASNDTMTTTTTTTSSFQRTAAPTVPSIGRTPTTPYLGRFGNNRLTPAPLFSPSSSTRAPLRDYLIYGIYPNKTIVRKRPEDNLIDARNVDSPYVIFGIFPDGKLVRKFPNGTIIPDPPRNPVEVVFSLSTSTTTNRPQPRPFYNQANQATYNQYQAPANYNNRRPIGDLMRNGQSPGEVDLGLTGNAIVGPNGGGPDFTGSLGTPASVATATKMSDVLLNTQMGTMPNAVSAIAGMLTPIASTARPPTDSQGGRIVQDRERDEATRTKEAGGQRSSVYIGQDKFVNYWTDGAPGTNPRVVSVKINSEANAVNDGPASSTESVPSFENLLNNQPNGRVTAPPGFPWRDPLDQIFGITTPSNLFRASVASNTLDDSVDSNAPTLSRPVNPFVEVFTPVSSTFGSARATASSTTPFASLATATSMPTITTTTSVPVTTTTTTAAPTTTTTTTTTVAPVTTARIGPTITTTSAPPVTNSVPTTTPFGELNLPGNQQQQNVFGTTFDDLAFLNSLLQVPNTQSTTAKTLTQVEQLLANKILSLAINNPPGPSRSAKAIDLADSSPNSIVQAPTKSPYEPIIIDLFPSSTTWKPAVTQPPTSQKPVESSSAPDQVTWKPVSTSTTKRDVLSSTTPPSTTKTTQISTTKRPVVITAKTVTTPKPKPTAPTTIGFGASLWQALFGGNLFGPSTTQKPVKAATKPTKTPSKSVSITPKPAQTTQKSVEVKVIPVETTQKPVETTRKEQVEEVSTTERSVNIEKIQVSTQNTILKEEKSLGTINSISTTKQPLLNNPNPRLPSVSTSTYSPEDDAKFLAALLRAFQTDNKVVTSNKASVINQDEEAFLRAILTGQGASSSTVSPLSEGNNAALLAALLKAQGIEPQTPANNIREQLSLASLGQSVTSAPSASSTTGSTTTITTRPASTATRPTVTTKKTVTPRPRPRTTTWSPSSTYPPPLFGSISNYGTLGQAPAAADNSGNARLFGATRAFSQFLGAAITGAAQQLQSLVRNGTRIVSEVVGK